MAALEVGSRRTADVALMLHRSPWKHTQQQGSDQQSLSPIFAPLEAQVEDPPAPGGSPCKP